MIQIFSNSLDKEELNAIEEIFKTKWVGNGQQCELFEKEFAAHINAKQILLTNNCTAAIYIALEALGIGPGDEVIISTINFVACAGAVMDMGAVPVFADVDPITLNILPEEIDRLKTHRTKAVFILHYAGHPAKVDEILQACGSRLMLIEDSANSVSSTYKGRNCGVLGDAGMFSFDAMKTLVMVDGGALVLKDEENLRKAQSIRYFGLAPKTTSGMDAMKEKSTRWWEYELVTTSGRFISNDVLASIGRIQLKKLPFFIARRKEIWDYYQSELSTIPQIHCPPEPLNDCTGSYYLYWIQLDKNRDQLSQYLAENDVYTTFRYFPLHLVNYFGSKSHLPNAEKVNETTLNIPLHQNLTDSDCGKIIELLRKFFQ